MNYQLYINGHWQDATGGNTYDVVNPATEEVAFTVAYGGRAEAAEAIDAAHAAFPIWSKSNPFDRARYLKKIADLMRINAEEYARLTTIESGKPYAQSRIEWIVAADIFEWFAEEAKRTYGTVVPTSRNNKRASVIWQPMGVVGVITAWNFPIWNLARPYAAALAAGCTIVAKPSEYTPVSALVLAKLVEEADLPKGVVNLINGDAAEIGEQLLTDHRVRKIHFVGSTRVGKLLMDKASVTNTRLSLELGGNAPLIVFDDVDIDKIAAQAAVTKFRNCGQVCISPQRFFIHHKAYDRFIEALAEKTKEFNLGNGLDSTSDIGPLINKRQQSYVAELVDADLENGAELVTGGEVPMDKGYFYAPTILKNVTKDHASFNQEIFGPVVPVTPFSSVEEAITLANNTEYGLAAYVFTNHLNTAIRMSEELEFGMVGVNEWTVHGTETPFLGWKQSGQGSELGPDGILEYMEKKLIAIGDLS